MNNKILLLGLVALTGALVYLGTRADDGLNDSAVLTQFATFRRQYGKLYSSAADAEYRLRVFGENLARINRHNADASQSYTLGVNQFTDMTFEELSAYYLGEDSEDRFQAGQDQTRIFHATSDERQVDWREHKIVNAVKNQANCGSCWAFSAVSVVEEAYALFKKEGIPTLAEQELVDCSTEYGNDGCGGGFSFQGLDYIRDKGINLEKDYPYHAKDETCKADISGKGAFKIKSWTKVEPGPQNMVDQLRKQPTTASFHVQSDFFAYKAGVYNPKSCPGNRNHAVNAVGFNLDDPVPYFIVRNSWGPSWGEKGFFRIAIKDDNGTCWFNGEGRTTFPVLE